MKKSSLIIAAGIMLSVLTIAAADLKLKQAYDAKNIQPYVVYTELPPFHFIKDNYSGKQSYEWYVCNVVSGEKYGVGVGFSIAEQILKFTVRNDTLFIEKKEGMSVNDVAFGVPISVFSGPLKGVEARVCDMIVTGKMADSITAHSVNKADIKFKNIETSYLKASADNTAKISITGTGTIPELSLTLRSQSSFSADNISILKKDLQLGDSASLQLTGKSVQDFGVRKNQ